MPNHLKAPDNFQPNKDLLELWLKTRKEKNKKIDGEDLPGFLSTHNYERDRLLSIIGVFIELGLGFWCVWNSSSYLESVGVIVFIIILDILIVRYMVNINTGEQTKINNALRFMHAKEANIDNPLSLGANNKSQLEKNYKIHRFNFISNVGILLECIFCFGKIYYMEQTYGLSLKEITTFAILGAYVFQTYCYIYSGGYFLAEWVVIEKVKKQINRFSLAVGKDGENDDEKDKETNKIFRAKEYSIPISTEITLKCGKRGIFELIEETPTSNKKNYILKCKGIPVDEQIIDFPNLQDEGNVTARREVMRQSHLLQLATFKKISS